MAGVTHRGLDPRTRPIRWAGFLLATAAVLLLFGGPASRVVTDWLTMEQDRLAWYAIRSLGILSWAALTGSVIYGLLLSTGILDAIAHRTVSFALHQELSAIGLGLALVHAALLTLDSTVPFSIGELLVPFAAPYRPVWVGLGQLGLYLTVVIVASFSVRRRIGQRTWRRLHYLTFLIALAATAHGVMAGSDSGAAFAMPMYGTALVTMVGLTAYRIAIAMRDRGVAPAPPRPATRPVLPPSSPPKSGVERVGTNGTAR
jgi:predicted ferric reductase